MPKVAILEYIHPSGINLLKKNSAFDFEIIEDISKENLINNVVHLLKFPKNIPGPCRLSS